MPEPLEDPEPPAVAPGVRHREAAGGDDDRIHRQRSAAFALHLPPARARIDAGDRRPREETRAFARGEREESVAHVARPVRRREEFPCLRLFHQRHPQLALEEGDLLRQRP
jgi:hypothetical protein